MQFKNLPLCFFFFFLPLSLVVSQWDCAKALKGEDANQETRIPLYANQLWYRSDPKVFRKLHKSLCNSPSDNWRSYFKVYTLRWLQSHNNRLKKIKYKGLMTWFHSMRVIGLIKVLEVREIKFVWTTPHLAIRSNSGIHPRSHLDLYKVLLICLVQILQ